MSLTDTAAYVVPYFKVKNMEKFQEIWKAAYDPFANKADCLHYAFCFDGDRAHCREAYTDGSKVLQHLADVDTPLKAVLDPEIASIERLEASGSAADIEVMREALTPLGCQFYTAEWGFRTPAPAQDPDTVIHLYPYFSITKGREADFKKIWSDAYPATQAAAGDEKNMMYAFCFSTDADGVTTALCREAYGDADGLLLHLKNVDTPLKAVLSDDVSTLKRLEVHGPAAELAKLKEALGPLGAAFFETAWGFRNEVA